MSLLNWSRLRISLNKSATVIRHKTHSSNRYIPPLEFDESNVPVGESEYFEEGEFKARRLSYMPPNLRQLEPRKTGPKPWHKMKERITIPSPEYEEPVEWVDEPKYPDIYDPSPSGVRRKFRLEWYESIKKLPTYEEKMYEITKQRDVPCIMLRNSTRLYNNLPLYQHLTRTHLIKGTLPLKYEETEEFSEDAFQRIKIDIIEAIKANILECQYSDTGKQIARTVPVATGLRNDNVSQEDLCNNVVAIMRRHLCKTNEYLVDCKVDPRPGIKSWWWVGNLHPPSLHRVYKRKPRVDQAISYSDSPVLQIRCKQPIQPIFSLDNVPHFRTDVPVHEYNPAKAGYPCITRSLTMAPGFWPEDAYDFPYLTIINRWQMKLRERQSLWGLPDGEDAVDAMAIISSFAWLNGLAAVHGFTPYDEITYPFTTQCIITDGCLWSFYVYQMNTHAFHGDVDKSNSCNVCWSSGEIKLFDTYENGELTGFNDTVLRYLIKLFVQVPQELEGMEPRPYLGNVDRDSENFKEVVHGMKHHFSQLWTSKKRKAIHGAKVYPYEYIYRFHKLATPTLHWRIRQKSNIRWPKTFS